MGMSGHRTAACGATGNRGSGHTDMAFVPPFRICRAWGAKRARDPFSNPERKAFLATSTDKKGCGSERGMGPEFITMDMAHLMLTSTLGSWHHYSRFIDEETEAPEKSSTYIELVGCTENKIQCLFLSVFFPLSLPSIIPSFLFNTFSFSWFPSPSLFPFFLLSLSLPPFLPVTIDAGLETLL